VEHNVLDQLIAKFPTFDPDFRPEEQTAWFAGFDRLLTIITAFERQEAARETVPAPIVEPVPTPGRNGTVVVPPRRPGNAVITATNMVDIRRLVTAGHSARAIAEELGLPQAAVGSWCTRIRKEAAAGEAGFRDGSRAATGQQHDAA
jgi:hypothetical protein